MGGKRKDALNRMTMQRTKEQLVDLRDLYLLLARNTEQARHVFGKG